MTQKTLYQEVGAHNRRLLKLHKQGLITRTETIISLKLVRGLGTAKAQVFQLRDPELVLKLEAGVDYGAFLSPNDLMAAVAKDQGVSYPT